MENITFKDGTAGKRTDFMSTAQLEDTNCSIDPGLMGNSKVLTNDNKFTMS